MLLNEICGKKIINSVTATFEGIVTGGVVTKCLKKICAFKVGVITVSKNGIREEKEIYIDPPCIASFKDALVTENLKEIDRPCGEDFLDAPLGTPVFNINGMMYGYLIDVCFNKNFDVTKLVYDRLFGIQKIISVSNDVIIAKAAMKKGNLNRAAYDGEILYRSSKRNATKKLNGAENLTAYPQRDATKTQLDEEILYRSQPHNSTLKFNNAKNQSTDLEFFSNSRPKNGDFDELLQNSDMYSNVNEINSLNSNDRNPNFENQFQPLQSLQKARRNPAYYFNKYPQKLICGYTFLLGRAVGEDIRNVKNEVIIGRGSIITDDVVEKAGAYGKLVELTFNSVK
jgi:hypothetical protein